MDDYIESNMGDAVHNATIGKGNTQAVATGNTVNVYAEREQQRRERAMTDSDRLMEKMDELTKAIVDLKMEMVSLKYRITALESDDVKRVWLLVVLSLNAVIMLAVLVVLIYRF